MKEYPSITNEMYGLSEFAPHGRPYDLTDLREGIMDYLEADDYENTAEVHDEISMMVDGLLEEDRCLNARTIVHEGAYHRNDTGQLIAVEGVITGRYQGIDSIYDNDAGCFLLFHKVSPPDLSGPDGLVTQCTQRDILVPLLSPGITIYPHATFADAEVARYIESPPSGEYQTSALQEIYERIKSTHPEEIDLLLTKLKQHFDAKGAQAAFETREGFVESGGTEKFEYSNTIESGLTYRGSILAFFEMDDYELDRKPHHTTMKRKLAGQKILGVALQEVPKEGCKPRLVKMPVLVCDAIYTLEAI